MWSEWNHWTSCSATCGGGMQSRRRKCKATFVFLCDGISEEERQCANDSCTFELIGNISVYADNLADGQRNILTVKTQQFKAIFYFSILFLLKITYCNNKISRTSLEYLELMVEMQLLHDEEISSQILPNKRSIFTRILLGSYN